MNNKILGLISVTFFGAFGFGCNDTGFSVLSLEGLSQVEAAPVCDPFSGGGTGDANKGLKGSLHYYEVGDSRISSIQNIASFAPGNPGVLDLPNPVYLNQLDVPTRTFSDGFSQGNGQLLKTLSGEVLLEWFSLRMESGLMAPSATETGDYQLALYSDDGAMVRVDTAQNGNFETIVDNDGIHGPTLKCAGKTIHIQAGTPLPVKIDYFQGPRHQIALQLLWRKFDSAGSGLGCDHSQLSVVPSRVFTLPIGNLNPCAVK